MARLNYGFQPTPAPTAPVNYAADRGFNPTVGPNKPGNGPQPTNTPGSVANLIKGQPKPVNLSDYYANQQAMYDAQMAQMAQYSGQMYNQQQQLNRMYAADPNAQYQRQMMALLGQDPLAAYRDRIEEQYQLPQRMNRLTYGFGM